MRCPIDQTCFGKLVALEWAQDDCLFTTWPPPKSNHMKSLTPEQIARIEYLARDAWVVDTGDADDESKSWDNFTAALTQMSSIELHYFACNFNWDCGIKELDAVIDHRECDAGTALTVYWLGQPATHYRMEARANLTPDAREIVALLRKIEAKLIKQEFNHCSIACDPFNIMGQPMTRGFARDREVVPAEMFRKIDGIEIEPYLC